MDKFNPISLMLANREWLLIILVINSLYDSITHNPEGKSLVTHYHIPCIN